MRGGVEERRWQLGSPSFGEFQPHTTLVTVVVSHHGDADQQEAEGASWRECGQAMAQPAVAAQPAKGGMDGLTGLISLGLQFVADGVFYAELNELLTRELAEDGYSGVEVRVTPLRTQIIIRATRTQGVLGKQYGDLAGWRDPGALAQPGLGWFLRERHPRPRACQPPDCHAPTAGRLLPGPSPGGFLPGIAAPEYYMGPGVIGMLAGGETVAAVPVGPAAGAWHTPPPPHARHTHAQVPWTPHCSCKWHAHPAATPPPRTPSPPPAGEKGRRIRELTSVVQKRFKFQPGAVELYAEKVANRGLCAVAQAESLRYKLLGGLAVRRACYGVLRYVMESGAKGCEVIVSGKLRAQRAKSMKFKDGYMVSSGNPVREYIDAAVRHVLLRQGVLGIKVKIMREWDPTGKVGPRTPLPDVVTVLNPKEEETGGLRVPAGAPLVEA